MAEFRPKTAEDLQKIPAGHRFVVFDGELAPTPDMLEPLSLNPHIRGILVSSHHKPSLPAGFLSSISRKNLFVHEIPDASSRWLSVNSQISALRERAKAVGESHLNKFDSAVEHFRANAGHAETSLLGLALMAFDKQGIPRNSVFSSRIEEEEHVKRATYAIDFLSKIDLRKVLENAVKAGRETAVAKSGLALISRSGGGEADFFPSYFRFSPTYLGTDLGYANFDFNDPERLHLRQLNLAKKYKGASHVESKDAHTANIGWRNLGLNTALVLAEAIGVKHLSVEVKPENLREEADDELVKELREFHDLTGIRPWKPVKEGGEVVRYERSVSGHRLLEHFGREPVVPLRVVKRLGSKKVSKGKIVKDA